MDHLAVPWPLLAVSMSQPLWSPMAACWPRPVHSAGGPHCQSECWHAMPGVGRGCMGLTL